MTVVILRSDGTSPVTRENVKHAFWQGRVFVLIIGEHDGPGRRYEHWPVERIDHVRIIETEAHQ